MSHHVLLGLRLCFQLSNTYFVIFVRVISNNFAPLNRWGDLLPTPTRAALQRPPEQEARDQPNRLQEGPPQWGPRGLRRPQPVRATHEDRDIIVPLGPVV